MCRVTQGTITAAVDGSALRNPGPAGWAWYVDDACWGAGGWPRATNNQGELTAVIELLRASAGDPRSLHIVCDSKYVLNSINEWLPGWKRRGWKRADGTPVQNRELLEALDAALVGRTVTYEWVRGHQGHPLNEAADGHARAAATAYDTRTPAAEGPGWRAGGSAESDSASRPALDPLGSRDSDADTALGVDPDLDLDTDLDAEEETALTLFGTEDLRTGWQTFTLQLTNEELHRLRECARAVDETPEVYLRGLIWAPPQEER